MAIKVVQNHVFGMLLLALSGLSATAPVAAADIHVLATNNMRRILGPVTDAFLAASGHRVTIDYDTGGAITRRIKDGAAFDVVITQRDPANDLVASGQLDGSTLSDFAKSSIDVIIRAGTARPDISSVETFRDALLKASHVAFTDPSSGGLVGTYFAKVLRDLQIEDALKGKIMLVPPPGAAVGERVARGDADIGINQKAELLGVPGIEFIGALPGPLNLVLPVTSGLSRATTQKNAAAAFQAFLTSSAAAPAIRAGGMEP
jgi:molybdate transport system substrate-binding protein